MKLRRVKSEQFSEESKIKNSWTLPSKIISSMEATLHVECTLKQYGFIYNSGCYWYGRFFWIRKEHYEISMQMGEDTLFPKISSYLTTTVCKRGTSCRHQILMERIRNAEHPVTILKNLLK
jgi:hypothetical protein